MIYRGGTSSTELIRGMLEAILDPVDRLVAGTDKNADELASYWAKKFVSLGVSPEEASSGIERYMAIESGVPSLPQILNTTLGEGWANTNVTLDKVMIGVGKIYDDKGLQVIYPYVFIGTATIKRGDLVSLDVLSQSREKIIENIKNKSTEESLRRFAVKHNNGNECGFADLMINEKYPDVWDHSSWGYLPSYGRPNKRCPKIAV